MIADLIRFSLVWSDLFWSDLMPFCLVLFCFVLFCLVFASTLRLLEVYTVMFTIYLLPNALHQTSTVLSIDFRAH